MGKDDSDNLKFAGLANPRTLNLTSPLGNWKDPEYFGAGNRCQGNGSSIPLLPGREHAERAIINFFLDTHAPPALPRCSCLLSLTRIHDRYRQLPKLEDMFKLEGFDYYLIPTAEVPRPICTDDLDAPPCRAITAPILPVSGRGRQRRPGYLGLIRQHQFNKVELVKFCEPEKATRSCSQRLPKRYSCWSSLPCAV